MSLATTVVLVLSEAEADLNTAKESPTTAARLDSRTAAVSGNAMRPHTRVIVAASAYALVSGKRVAGMYDHTAARHVRVAAEARGEYLQGYDGDREARFGGTLPELRDAGDGALLHVEMEGATVRGYDRSSSSHFTATVAERLVQLHDHAGAMWFSFDIHVA